MPSRPKREESRGILIRTTIAAAIAGSFFSSAAFSQDENTEAQGATKLDTIEVTGSRIRRVDVEGPAPVKVIGRQEIENSGYVNVQDVLDNLTQNSGGTIDQSFTFGFTPGAAGVDLRGFGAGRTLVLLDGRRLPAYPIGLGGTDSFVDLSTIPASQIERIEILTDGASSIYGSDAVSGVVNIITRKDIQGTFASARVGGTQHGGFANQRFQVLSGVTSADSSLTFNAEYYHNNPLAVSQRDYSASDFTDGGLGSSFGSTFFGYDGQVIADPNCGNENDAIGGQGVLVNGVCRFDRTPYRQYFPELERGFMSVRGDRDFGGFNGYARASYFQSTTKPQSEPNAYAGGEGFDSSNPFGQLIPFTVHNFGDVPAGAPNNPTTGTDAETDGFYQRRLVEYGPRGSDIDTRAISVLLGLEGSFGAFTWDVGLARNEQKVKVSRPNILSSLLDNEVANNGLNLFAPVPADVIARTTFQSNRDAITRNTLVDGTITGPLPMMLPGGPVQFAFHAEWDSSKYFDRADPITLIGDAFDGATSGGGERDYYGAGIELLVPIVESLELNVSGRYDRYNDDSDVGGAFSPKVSLAYRPVESVLLRASAGQSFRAPDLQRLFGGNTSAFNSVVDTVRCFELGGTKGDESIPACVDPVQSVPILIGSNPNLEEEEGQNFNFGIVWEAVTNLTFKLDYYDIELEKIVTDPSIQFILDSCAEEGVFCDQIVRPAEDLNGDGAVLDENGALVRLVAQNLASQRIKGIDFGTEYEMSTTSIGKFTYELDVSWIRSLTLQLTEDDDATEQIDFASIPEYRAGATVDWALGDFGAFVRGNYVHSYPGDFSNGPNPPDDEYIPSWTTFDLQMRYNFGRLGMLRLGVDNVLDKDFPLDPTAQGGNRPNQFITGPQFLFADAFGRAGYLQYEISF